MFWKNIRFNYFRKTYHVDIWQNSKYVLDSMYARVLNIPISWICNYYDYVLSSTYGRLLSNPEFWINQASEFTTVSKGSKYAWIMLEYAWISLLLELYFLLIALCTASNERISMLWMLLFMLYLLHWTYTLLSINNQFVILAMQWITNKSSSQTSHIPAYWHIFRIPCKPRMYSKPCLDPNFVIFKIGAIFKFWWNFTGAYSEPCHGENSLFIIQALFSRIQAYSEHCVILPYAATWYVVSPKIFRIPLSLPPDACVEPCHICENR